MGGPGLIGQFSSTLANSPNTLGQRFQPSETIQTGQAMRYMNAVLGEAEFPSAGGPHLPSLVRMGFCISRMLAISAATCSMRKPAMTTLLNPKNSIAVLASYGKMITLELRIRQWIIWRTSPLEGRYWTAAFQAAGGRNKSVSTVLETGTFNFGRVINAALTYERRRGISVAFVRGLTEVQAYISGARSNTLTGRSVISSRASGPRP